MKYLDQTLPSPAQNLALDEALLEIAEQEGVECLRCWESGKPFVVLGLSNQAGQELDPFECERRGVPVLRRFSGGGTVVQGPGCLSYALALRIEGRPALATVTQTNRFIMETHRAVIGEIIGAPVAVRGHTDLETGGRKFSGNAQRRGRRALLFHGTFLYAADVTLFGDLLKHPSREPDWRAGRTHQDFLANLPATRDQIAAALRSAWRADENLDARALTGSVERLAARHHDPDWIRGRS